MGRCACGWRFRGRSSLSAAAWWVSMLSGSRLVGPWCVVEVSVRRSCARLASAVGLARSVCRRVWRPLRVAPGSKIARPTALRAAGPHARIRVRLVGAAHASVQPHPLTCSSRITDLAHGSVAARARQLGVCRGDGSSGYLLSVWAVCAFSGACWGWWFFFSFCKPMLSLALICVGGSQRFLAPPSSVLRLNPSV